jgi:hypothetical protein
VEVRHCQDWHRVERTRRRMESELRRRPRRFVA